MKAGTKKLIAGLKKYRTHPSNDKSSKKGIAHSHTRGQQSYASGDKTKSSAARWRKYVKGMANSRGY